MSDLINKTNEQLPAFMQSDEKYGDELMGRYIRPPRIKVIQAQAGETYDQFDHGSVVITPQNMLVAGYDKATKKGELWKFVPIFFYPEWCTWNPLGSDEPMIAARTFDPQNEIAVKAQSPETWTEKRSDGQEVRHVEHLNFIIAPLAEQFVGMQFALTFIRAEQKVGTTLCSLISMRNAPICGQIFDAQVGYRKNKLGQWYGIDVSIPKDGTLFVTDEELYTALKSQHETYRKAHESRAIQVDFEDMQQPSVTETDF